MLEFTVFVVQFLVYKDVLRFFMKRAYISVFDKTGIVEFASRLEKAGYEIVSTGGTFDLLAKNGIKAVESADITGFRELISGKVKSLHPKIFAGILADLKEREELSAADCKAFDLVCVNLYPFEEYKGKDVEIETLVKNIDIGGVALLRAGAKNFENVVVISDVKDYEIDIENVDLKTRENLAVKAFQRTSKYDFEIMNEFERRFRETSADVAENEEQGALLEHEAFYLNKIKDLRYGENPHQAAALYNYGEEIEYEFLNGKEFSYNNILDATAALNIAAEFFDVNAAVIIKHTNPCGVALGKTLLEAWQKALDCDPLSAFGGIVAFTKKVDLEIAKNLTAMFLEVVIAPEFTEDAVDELKKKKNLRVVRLLTPLDKYLKFTQKEIRLTPFGALLQEKDSKELDPATFKTVTKEKPTQEMVEDMVFAFKVCKHLKSNAIVVAKDLRTLGLCGGQTSRVGSVEIALKRVCDSAKGSVIASDGFFPAIDNIEVAAQERVAAIIQPGGSIKDPEVIKTADKLGLVMVTTGIRHFRH